MKSEYLVRHIAIHDGFFESSRPYKDNEIINLQVDLPCRNTSYLANPYEALQYKTFQRQFVDLLYLITPCSVSSKTY